MRWKHVAFLGVLVGLLLNAVRFIMDSASFFVDPGAENDLMLPSEDSYATSPRPPLDALITAEYGNVIGDPQFLLDFAIIGHGKCGTSTMMSWLGSHPEALCFQDEVNLLMMNKTAKLVKKLYTEMPEGPFKRGYKSPSEVRSMQPFRQYAKYFPKTKLIVGIRHPVLWFESLYNFRVQNYRRMPPADSLIGKCTKQSQATCTEMAKYHKHLARMRKVKNMTSRQLMHFQTVPHHILSGSRGVDVPNPVFLFDVSELADPDEERAGIFRKALQNFLGFKKEFPPNPHYKPGKKYKNAKVQAEKDRRKINICDASHDRLRGALMEISWEVAVWLEFFFLKSPDVVVANRDRFLEIMRDYTVDPCIARNNSAV